jgi:hypothetical protein
MKRLNVARRVQGAKGVAGGFIGGGVEWFWRRDKPRRPALRDNNRMATL